MSVSIEGECHNLKRSFIFLGNDFFKKLDCFETEQNKINSDDKYIKLFSGFKLDNSSTFIDIFIGWSFLLIKTNQGICHWGFYKTAIESCLVHKIFSGAHDLSCGLSDSYYISENLDLYHISHTDFFPYKINTQDKKLSQIATEDLFALTLTFDGKVLDIKKAGNEILATPIDIPHIVKQIACGKEHILLLTTPGVVLSYGFGSRGQLGHDNIHKLEKPEIIEALEGIEISTIAAGGWHSAAISSIGDLYMWGWNESGQLGLPCPKRVENGSAEIFNACYLPKLIDLNDTKVTKVACGSRHTAAVTEDKEVWTWGWNNWGQLGNKSCLFNDKPTKIELAKNFIVQDVKCKFWNTLIEGYIEK